MAVRRHRTLLALLLLAASANQASAWQRTFHGPTDAWLLAVGPARELVAVLSVPTEGRALGFAVVKMQGNPPAEVWRHRVVGEGDEPSAGALALVVDRAGDVVVNARIETVHTADQATIIKLDGGTGAERWRHVVRGVGTYSSEQYLYPMVANAGGDVVVAGSVSTVEAVGRYGDFAVIQLDGTTGEERWRYTFAPPGVHAGSVEALAVDARDDVLAAGYVSTDGPGGVIAVKLDGGTGAERWRTTVDRATRSQDIRLDSAGSAFLAASVKDDAGTGSYFGAVALDTATGAVRWATPVVLVAGMWGEAYRIAVDLHGDLVTAGVGHTSTRDTRDGAERLTDVVVAKFAGSTGVERWRRVLGGTYHEDDDGGPLVVDGAGDVYAAGTFFNLKTCYDIGLVKLDRATGAVVWSRTLDGSVVATSCFSPCGDYGPCHPGLRGIDTDYMATLSPGPDGGVVVAGKLVNWREDAVHQDAFLLGLSDRITGERMRISPSDERADVDLRSKDTRVLTPAPDDPDAPSRTGAVVRFTNLGTGATVSVDLPTSGWMRQRVRGGWRWILRAPGTRCRSVRVETGRGVRARCTVAGDELLGSSPAARIGAEIAFGSGARWCVAFDGRIESTAHGSRFTAGPSPAPSTCR